MQDLSKFKKTYKEMAYLYVPSNVNRAKTLLILHGWMQTKETWKDVIEILSNEFNIICPDLPGFGESTKDKSFFSFTPKDYADFLHGFLMSIGVENVSILGHSYGGRITVAFAETYKDMTQNIIIYASPGMETTNSAYYSLLHHFKTVSHSRLANSRVIKEIKDKLKTRIGSRDYKASGERETLFLNAIEYEVSKHLKSLSVNTLIIWGENDEELDVSQAFKFQKEIKNSQVFILKSYGHFAHMQTPVLFAKTVSKFLNNEKIY